MSNVHNIVEDQFVGIEIKHKLEKELDELVDSWLKIRENFQKNKELLLSIYRQVVDYAISVRMTNSLDIRVAGGKAELANTIRILRKAGYNTNAQRPQKGDTEWAAFWYNPNCGVNIYFHFSSTVCKRVKVGTKIVVQDVYETVCDAGDLSDVALPEEVASTNLPVSSSSSFDNAF